MNTTHVTEITTVESLVAEARRRGFNITGGFMPRHLIPMVEAAIGEHNTRERGYTETSGEYIEWKQTMDNLQEFLALLKTLPERLPYESATRTSTTGTATAPASLPSDSCDDEDEDAEDDDEDDLEEEDNEDDTESLIEKVEKYLAENDKNARRPRPQSDTPVADPLHTRCPGGDHPLDNAFDASANASADANSSESKLAQERAEYLAQLMRESTAAKSPIDDLPPERQRALYQLIQDEAPLTVIVKMIGAPEPLGWGFKTTHASLRRFRKRYQKKLKLAKLADVRAEAEETLQQTGGAEQTYTDATRRLLKIRLYQNAADPKSSEEAIEILTRLLDRQRRTDLSERRVQVLEHRATQTETK